MATQVGFVGDDLTVEDGVTGELGEPGFGFLSGGAREGGPVVVGVQFGEELAAGEGFFGLDLVAEAGVAGAGVAPSIGCAGGGTAGRRRWCCPGGGR